MLDTVTLSIKHTHGNSYPNRLSKYGKLNKNLKLDQKEFCVPFITFIRANLKKSSGYLWT